MNSGSGNVATYKQKCADGGKERDSERVPRHHYEDRSQSRPNRNRYDQKTRMETEGEIPATLSMSAQRLMSEEPREGHHIETRSAAIMFGQRPNAH